MEERAHILLVDDDAVDRMAVRRALRNTGWILTFTEAEHGAATLAAIQNERFDCIILDYMLPGTDGLAVLREIRGLGIATPIVMLTNQGDEQLIVALIKAGADDYLPKGKLAPEDVWQRVRAAVRFGRAKAEAAQAETLRHAAETARQQSEHLLATTLRSIGDAVIATDRDGRITFMNAVAEALTGWDAPTAYGRDLGTIFHIVNEHTRELIDQPFAKTLHEGSIVGLANHTILIARDGSEYPIDDSGAPISDSAGNVIGVVVVFRNIIERKVAENALRESEVRFRTMADTAPILLWMSGTDGLCDFVNEGWLRFSGRTMAQEIGSGWLESVHPDDRGPCMQTYLTAFHARRTFEMEYRMRRHDGQYRWILNVGAPRFMPDGQFLGYIGSCLDLTHRKLAEERLRFLAEASRLLSSTLDHELRLSSIVQLAVPFIADWCAIDLLNERGELRRLAVETTDAALLARERALQQHMVAAPDGQRVAQILDTGESFLTNQIDDDLLQAIALDDDHLALLQTHRLRSLIMVPMMSHGQSFGIISLALTNTDRTYRQDDLQLAEDLARRAAIAVDNARLYHETQEAVRGRDAFLSIAAHELKTPLTSLMGYADLLDRRTKRDNTTSERDRRAVQVIADQAARLNKMISSLLDLSRIQTGQLSIERSVVDLNALVQRLADEVQLTLQQHTLQITTTPDPVLVNGDELRLEQVVQNLIQNAIKYSPAGSSIRVKVYTSDGQACVDVVDTGMGIPEASLARIFQRFYRADNIDAQHISGMGVGLFVVREIMTLHGGSVSVKSKVGEGSTFTVWLPRYEGEE